MNLITTIDRKFTFLNEYINAERKNRYVAAKIKKEETEIARLYFLGKEIKTPCKLKFVWHIKTKARDADNISFAKKYILDGMCKAGTIPNDNLTHIQGFEDEFVIDSKEYVEVYKI